ncbi:EBNA-1 nuclear protein [Sphingobium sp. Leaf26]|nr:EBNA-1 nuclear protein [Sphingobium sp. Leaf26]
MQPGGFDLDMLVLPRPYLLFLGDATERGFAKTALGLADWAPDLCIGEYGLPGCTVTAGLPQLTPAEARAMGARALVIGVANVGGVIPDQWMDALVEALEQGFDLVSGMHAKLASFPRLAHVAAQQGRKLIDIRMPPRGIPIATGRKRSGKRLLTVGTDCALGKKYTALAIADGLRARGVDADFRASGQTGIMIAGSGMPMDSVVSDFLAGAAEILSPDAPKEHWDVIEGQGSLFHPAYATVSLGLLHGSQPDVFVVCHEVGRTEILGVSGYSLPSIAQVIEQTIAMGRLTNPAIRCAGISLNTASLDAVGAAAEIDRLSAELGYPVADPIRRGPAFDRLLDACLA